MKGMIKKIGLLYGGSDSITRFDNSINDDISFKDLLYSTKIIFKAN